MTNKNTKKKNTDAEQGTKRSNEAVRRELKRRQIWSLVMFAFGILIILFSFIGSSKAENPNGADIIHMFLCGLFGISVFFIGPIIIYMAIMMSSNKIKYNIKTRTIQLITAVLLICIIIQLFFGKEISGGNIFDLISNAYTNGKNLSGGGIIGLIFAFPLSLFGMTAARIIIILIAFVFIMISANIGLIDFFKLLSIPFKKLFSFIGKKHSQYKEDNQLLQIENEKRMESERIIREAVEETEYEINKKKKFASIEAATSSVHIMANNVPENKNEPEETNLETNLTRSIKTYTTDDDEIMEGNFEPLSLVQAIEEIEKDSMTKTPIKALPIMEMPDDGPYSPDGNFKGNNAVIDAINEFKKEEDLKEFEKTNNENSLLELEGAEVIPEKPPIIETSLPSISELKEIYTLPPILLLNDIIPEKSAEDIEAELDANSTTLVETLKSFGVMTKIVGVCRGPSVTRYEIQPAAGVKISKITGLVDDIALNLATAGVRIEAPIPNKAAVGIEVPNRKVDTVPFRSLVDSDTFRETESKLGAVLGKDISGEIIIADIAKMPHLLIAGTTGSGKSVCVNSIIMSILFRSTPDDVRLLMIDPKAVEFMIYNGIPHLLIPVVTDPKKAAGALGWAVTEMLNRYKLFAENNVRDLNGYNSLCKGNPELESLPQIVIFIDELADLMMASPGEVEDSICRLAQMARAAGMHLVIATQRPSVNVVTGVIKANVPSRIALKVASQVDSRTIIDSAGAEKLLGKGDMLYFPVGMPKPTRVQGCWVSDKEVERVVDFIKNSFILNYDESVIQEIERQAENVTLNDKKSSSNNTAEETDEKLDEAIEAVIEAGRASTSYLQRELGLGYGRAAKLIDIMERMGIVGEFNGSKPREILMTRQEWYERKLNK